MKPITLADQRQHIRIPSSRPVLIMMNNQTIYATMTDFSKHGIGFLSEQAAQEHQRIEVHFDIPLSYHGQQHKAFQFKAEVKHCLNFNQKSHIGVKLDFPTHEYLTLFDQLSHS